MWTWQWLLGHCIEELVDIIAHRWILEAEHPTNVEQPPFACRVVFHEARDGGCRSVGSCGNIVLWECVVEISENMTKVGGAASIDMLDIPSGIQKDTHSELMARLTH